LVVPDLIVFPDTDLLLRTMLLQGLTEHGVTGVDVVPKVPNNKPERFIVYFTLPGREICPRTQLCQATVQVYDSVSVARCADLARLCGAVVRSAPEMVIDGERNGPFPSADPDLPTWSRYQVNVTWTVQSKVKQAK
jgi:hypothetical protein